MSNNRMPVNQQPGNFRMQQQFPQQQYVQPGMMGYPMMQGTGHMMQSHGPMQRQPNMMFPGQMAVRRPSIAPPPYRPTGMGQQYRANTPQMRQMSPETMKKMEKEKFYQEQKQKLKQFHTQSVDPNKLIESMFGKTEKPKVKEKQTTPAAEEDINDSFGDFIGGPSVVMTTPQQEPEQQAKVETTNNGNLPTSETTGNQSPRGSNQDQKSEKKADLNAMMMECSDLSAPIKAKTFHKPSLKEVHPSHHALIVKQHESNQARHWKDVNDLGDIFVAEEPVVQPRKTTPEQKDLGLPHWCKDESKLPDLYKHVLEASLVDGLIQTERLYPILLLSGLPKDVLGHIWSMCNKMTPGQLIKEELYLVLGFIFLAQNNQPLSIELLHRIPQAPIPFIAPPQPPPPAGLDNTAPQINQQMPQVNQQMPQINQQTPHSSQPDKGVSVVPPSNVTVPISGTGPVGIMPVPMATNMPVVPPGNTVVHGIGPTGQTIVPMTTGNVNQIKPVPRVQTNTQLPGPAADGWHSHNIGEPVKPVHVSTLNKQDDDDDEFADFQEAPKIQKEVVKPKASKPVSAKEDKKEYLYSVPLPDDDLPENQLSTEQHYSNVSNFFGSDDSSVSACPKPDLLKTKGASTPNSMDDDFDDFKSAGRPSDSSQFTSSEQSENEDFKVLETYLDDFSKKKQQIEKQESPLHRPISKTTNLPATAYTQNVNPIPAIKSLWPKQDSKTPKPTDVSKITTFSPQSSDTEFADFQQAPVPSEKNLSASKSASDLIGDEDKYAALRIDTSGPSLFGTEDNAQDNVDMDDNDWADFKSTDTIVQGDQTENLFSSLASTGSSNSDWSNVQNLPAKQETDLFSTSAVSEKTDDDWSDFSQVPVSNKNGNDEWADFQGPSQNTDNKTDVDKSPAPIISVSQSDLVNVKKKNLQHNEILGLFAPRSDPETLSSYILPELSQKENEKKQDENKEYLETNIDEPRPFQQSFPVPKPQNIPKLSVDDDEDLFRAPPPMDDGMDDDDEYGDFSRGYDIDEVSPSHLKPVENKKIFSLYGMEFTSSNKSKDQQKTESNQFTFQSDTIPGDVKFGKNLKSEDTNSVSSLDLPFSKTIVQNVKDSDSISVSSNEFAADFPQEKTMPDSKSIDSLDLKISESKSVDSLEMKAAEAKSVESSDMEDKSDEQNGGGDSDKNTEENNTVLPGLTGMMGQVSQPVPLFGDRYSGIMEDITGSDKYAYEWQRCLENCCKLIKDANNIFNSISSSSVCNEVIRSEQGTDYVQGIVEIYRIVCRITLSMKNAALSTNKLSQTLKDVDLVWNNLTAFLVGGNIMPDDNIFCFKHCLLKSDDLASQMRACGVCLLDVDVRDLNSEEESGKLTYGGRQYHATCANFWVNCVDSMLPALKLPELL